MKSVAFVKIILGIMLLLACEEKKSNQTQADQAVSDQTMIDHSIFDQAVSDQTMIDRSVFDQAISDQTISDSDQTISDQSISDQTISDSDQTISDQALEDQMYPSDMMIPIHQLMPIEIEASVYPKPRISIEPRENQPFNHIERLGEYLLVEAQDLSIALSTWQSSDLHIEFNDDLPTPIQGTAVITENLTDLQLILANQRLYATRPPEVRISPIDTAINQPILAMNSIENEIWFATSENLYLWRNGILNQISIQGLDLSSANPQLILGARFRGVPVLWLHIGHQLFAIERFHPQFQTWRISNEIQFEKIVADQLGSLWGISEGILYHRSIAGVWQSYAFADQRSILGLSGGHDSAQLWFWLENTDQAPNATWMAMFVGETLYFWDYSEDLAMIGQDFRQIISKDQQSIISSELGLFQLRFNTDDLPIPPRIITWQSHIQAIYERSCASCHQYGGVAHLLDSKDRWVDEFDLILNSIERGQMPLASQPLSIREQDLIRAWRSGGYQ
jgi:hypothetical protein